MNKWILIFLAVTFSAQATEWQPPEGFLKAVRLVESSNGKFLYGDEGRSLGDFQISEAAWLDVNSWRQARRLKTYDYRANVMNAFINRVYASNYLSMLHGELSRKLKRAPTYGEMYAAYNMGLAAFAQCKFELGQVNSVTRSKSRLIEEMLASAQ